MKVIRDPVHGNIEVEDHFLEIIDLKEFQRLRFIRQLGTGYLVYPGANHTRFEHSLGVFWITKRVLSDLNLEWPEMLEAALLHDIGHGPFSHVSEELAKEIWGKTHEDFGKRIVKDLGFSKETRKLAFGPSLVTMDIGTDRMDYLLRDSHYTGVAYGIIDHERLIQGFIFQDGEFLINGKVLAAAESLILARYLMFPNVYLHKTTRIADEMLIKASKVYIRDQGISFHEFMKLKDFELLSLLEKHESTGELAGRILERRLYKPAFILRWADLNEEEKEKARREKIEKKEKIEEELGECVVCMPYGFFKEVKAKIVHSQVSELSEISTLVRMVKEAQWDHWSIIVAVPEERRDEIKSKSEEIREMIFK